MSDPAARCCKTGNERQRATPDRAPGVDEALGLCIEAAASFAEGAPCGVALDSLEELLPTLDPADVDTLIGHADYTAIRSVLIRACAETWFERECELAHRTLADASSPALRTLFGDHIPRDAYADELAVLHRLQPRNILIVGNGACPMSAIVIQEAFPAAVVAGMDRSTRACELASGLLAACGQDNVAIMTGDALNPPDIERFDCILLALTVGIDETEKRDILHALGRAADPNAVFVVRTAAGWGRVLYPATDLPAISGSGDSHADLPPHARSVAVAVPAKSLPG